MGGKAEALRLQRQRATPGKRVMKAGQDVEVEEFGGLGVVAVEVAGFAPAFPDGVAGTLQDFFVVGVFPFDQIADDGKEALAAGFGFVFVAGVVHHLREDDGTRCRQRPPRPPQVQGAGVAVADGFFARGGGVDVIKRQGDFDEFFRQFDGLGHGVSWLG